MRVEFPPNQLFSPSGERGGERERPENFTDIDIWVIGRLTLIYMHQLAAIGELSIRQWLSIISGAEAAPLMTDSNTASCFNHSITVLMQCINIDIVCDVNSRRERNIICSGQFLLTTLDCPSMGCQMNAALHGLQVTYCSITSQKMGSAPASSQVISQAHMLPFTFPSHLYFPFILTSLLLSRGTVVARALTSQWEI